MHQCHACGKVMRKKEAFVRTTVGGQDRFFCCPMCLSAFKAGSLQRKMVLQDFADDRVSILVEYLPALQVSGDYAYLHAVGDNKLYVMVADVSGHGVTSSMIMSRVSAETEHLVKLGRPVTAIARKLNRQLLSFQEEEIYLTLFAAEIDFSLHLMTYINCGHPAQLLWRKEDQQFTRLESRHFPIGLFGPDTFGVPPKAEAGIHPGDKLILFTDGALDLEIEEGQPIGESGLIDLFYDLARHPTEEMKRSLFERIRTARQNSSRDDLLFIFMDIKANATGAALQCNQDVRRVDVVTPGSCHESRENV